MLLTIDVHLRPSFLGSQAGFHWSTYNKRSNLKGNVPRMNTFFLNVLQKVLTTKGIVTKGITSKGIAIHKLLVTRGISNKKYRFVTFGYQRWSVSFSIKVYRSSRDTSWELSALMHLILTAVQSFGTFCIWTIWTNQDPSRGLCPTARWQMCRTFWHLHQCNNTSDKEFADCPS